MVYIEIFGVFAGLVAIGIILLIFIAAFGLVKWLLQGYFLFRIAERKNLDIPLLSFVPFGTFYVAGQEFDGNVFQKGSFKPKHLGLIFAITGLVVYLLGLSIGDIAISYLLMESIIFIGIFNAYTRNIGVAILLALLNILTAGIAAIVVLFLYHRKLSRTFNDPVVREEPGNEGYTDSGKADNVEQHRNI
ncbi:hypothetical protein [Lacicoccus alkaliphilus]|uniref:Uncharacterized protein n=1 Tax=Lacicoccus alkaliphilus DSM 16010 TaxID=1123231 RepID=A0A1M7IIP7_9BACL|nr:hypothetical protein [Salinicoccus alkaliphilus]SHM40535.1 hypothetical protein SAMN02745189_02106 [Salinicoccus alkaliphilus DSM 16010]